MLPFRALRRELKLLTELGVRMGQVANFYRFKG